MAVRTSNRDVNKLIRRAIKEAGFTIIHTGGCHLKWQAPSGKFFFSSATPSDVRALKNIKADLRRATDGAFV